MLRASRKLLISQPAVSKSIRVLEEALGQELFQRNRGELALTPAGEKVLGFARLMRSKVEDLEQSLVQLDRVSGVLRIGTYETLAEVIWPNALALLKKAYPALWVHLETEGAGSIWNQLKSGELEMIIDAEPQSIPSFVSKVLYKDVFQVFQAPRYAQRDEESVFEFAYVEAATDRKGLRIADHLTRLGIQHRLMYSVQTFTFVRALILKGLCVGVLPRRLAAQGLAEGRLEPFIRNGNPIIFGEHRICATFPNHAQKSPRIKAVLDAFKLA